MIKTYVGDRSKHSEVGIVTFLRFQEICQRFLVPAVEISFLGPASIRSRFSFELCEANLVQDVAERLLVHLELPDNVAQEKIEVGVELIESPGKLFERELDTVARLTRAVAYPRAQRAQS